MLKYSYEVRPCHLADANDIEECAPDEAGFWGVYKRPTQGELRLADWVADFNDETDAREWAKHKESQQ